MKSGVVVPALALLFVAWVAVAVAAEDAPGEPPVGEVPLPERPDVPLVPNEVAAADSPGEAEAQAADSVPVDATSGEGSDPAAEPEPAEGALSEPADLNATATATLSSHDADAAGSAVQLTAADPAEIVPAGAVDSEAADAVVDPTNGGAPQEDAPANDLDRQVELNQAGASADAPTAEQNPMDQPGGSGQNAAPVDPAAAGEMDASVPDQQAADLQTQAGAGAAGEDPASPLLDEAAGGDGTVEPVSVQNQDPVGHDAVEDAPNAESSEFSETAQQPEGEQPAGVSEGAPQEVPISGEREDPVEVGNVAAEGADVPVSNLAADDEAATENDGSPADLTENKDVPDEENNAELQAETGQEQTVPADQGDEVTDQVEEAAANPDALEEGREETEMIDTPVEDGREAAVDVPVHDDVDEPDPIFAATSLGVPVLVTVEQGFSAEILVVQGASFVNGIGLKCRITGGGTPIEDNAEFITEAKVHCLLPLDAQKQTDDFLVEVTNDGSSYSNPVAFRSLTEPGRSHSQGSWAGKAFKLLIMGAANVFVLACIYLGCMKFVRPLLQKNDPYTQVSTPRRPLGPSFRPLRDPRQ